MIGWTLSTWSSLFRDTDWATNLYTVFGPVYIAHNINAHKFFKESYNCLFLYNSYMYWYEGQYHDIQTAQGSWYGPVEMILPEPEARAILFPLVRNTTKGQSIYRKVWPWSIVGNVFGECHVKYLICWFRNRGSIVANTKDIPPFLNLDIYMVFAIFWLWAYLVKVFPEAVVCTKLYICVFISCGNKVQLPLLGHPVRMVDNSYKRLFTKMFVVYEHWYAYRP
jgi:hypothetical protein